MPDIRSRSRTGTAPKAKLALVWRPNPPHGPVKNLILLTRNRETIEFRVSGCMFSFSVWLRWRTIVALAILCLTPSLSHGQSGPILAITKSHNGDFTTGQPGTYFITVSNAGQTATSGTVTMSDALPQGMTAISLDAPGWSCSALPTTFITCTRSDSLAPAASYPVIAITVSVGNCMPTETNTAEVSGGGDPQFHTAS